MKENQQIIIDLQTVRDVCQRSIESRKQMNIIIIQKLEREREREREGIFLFFFNWLEEKIQAGVACWEAGRGGGVASELEEELGAWFDGVVWLEQ